MFKNIELSEIDKKVVLNSLLISWFICFTLLFVIEIVFFGLVGGTLIVIMAMISTAVFWVPTIVASIILERLVLGKTSTEKTVKMLFFFEILIPLSLVLITHVANDLSIVLWFLFILSCGQFLRWFYLRVTGKIFSSATFPNKSNPKSYSYEN